jgi:hypothetical protein
LARTRLRGRRHRARRELAQRLAVAASVVPNEDVKLYLFSLTTALFPRFGAAKAAQKIVDALEPPGQASRQALGADGRRGSASRSQLDWTASLPRGHGVHVPGRTAPFASQTQAVSSPVTSETPTVALARA